MVNGSEICIRPAMPADTRGMLEITRPVWDGNDYVPFVWQRWLADPHSYVSVAEVLGRIVGLMHVDIQQDGTAWLEGIRVREDVQSRGIGQAMLEDAIGWLRGAGYPRLRLATYGGNPASNRLARKAGLREVATYSVLHARPVHSDSTDELHFGLPAQLDELWSHLADSGRNGPATVYTEGWTAYSLDRSRLASLLATQAVLVLGESELEGLAIATSQPQRPRMRLGYLTGSAGARRALVRGLLQRSADRYVSNVISILPSSAEQEGILIDAGFDGESLSKMILYELTLQR